MKITLVYGAMPNYDAELSKVLKIVSDTFLELEVEIETINLAFEQIPYFDGIGSQSDENIIQRIKTANGVIFAATSVIYGIPAIMRAFLEHLALPGYGEAICGKNCMIIVCSHLGDERSALNEFSLILNRFGAFDSVKIGVPPAVAKTIGNDESDIITRQSEDFYRIVRQNRKFIIPGKETFNAPIAEQTSGEEPMQEDIVMKPDIATVYEKLNLNSMTSKQEKDVGDIAELLSKKHINPQGDIPSAILQMPSQNSKPREPKQARVKTCKQMTQGMPHYFQPQIAPGFSATVQINITGGEIFEGYVVINNADCQYFEGIGASPDITVISDAAVWREVLTGRLSAQKAFMVGKLKVRGNFVVLTKLEQLFKPMT